MADQKIRVLPDPEAVAAEAAELVVAAAGRAIELTGRFTLGLAGGSTPGALYQLLATPAYAGRMDWSKTHVFFGDERCVPSDHAQSNFAMASAALLDHVPIPYENVHRMRGEDDPQESAIAYGRLLKQVFGDGGLDLALLGMGEDGHTASLFPGTDVLAETHHRCAAVFVPKLDAWRITMTAPFLNRSAEVVIMVTGAGKSATLSQVLEGDRDPQRFPIQLIQPQGRLSWLLDAAAAGME